MWQLVLAFVNKIYKEPYLHREGAILCWIFEYSLIYIHANEKNCILDATWVLVQFVSISGTF